MDVNNPCRSPWYETRIRVRYPEVDPQGVVHHAVYLHYFEAGRTELLRSLGLPYRRIEEEGTQLVVTECRLRYLQGAGYDEELTVRTRVEGVSRVRIFLSYQVLREGSGEVACEGSTVLASVDTSGKPKALPENLTRKMKEAAC
ncbi:MAG: acyl-CoA thioesterase [Planctomycetes bacterium]|nr:acyl-CoA thioesterase [Planctomycetota bacterium]